MAAPPLRASAAAASAAVAPGDTAEGAGAAAKSGPAGKSGGAAGEEEGGGEEAGEGYGDDGCSLHLELSSVRVCMGPARNKLDSPGTAEFIRSPDPNVFDEEPSLIESELVLFSVLTSVHSAGAYRGGWRGSDRERFSISNFLAMKFTTLHDLY